MHIPDLRSVRARTGTYDNWDYLQCICTYPIHQKGAPAHTFPSPWFLPSPFADPNYLDKKLLTYLMESWYITNGKDSLVIHQVSRNLINGIGPGHIPVPGSS